MSKPQLFSDDGNSNKSNDVDPTSTDFADEFQRWLRSSSKWSDSLMRGWTPIRFLGHGGNGAAGLWRYTGNNPRPGTLEAYVREVVVKQSDYLNYEAAIMEALTLTGSHHVPEIYGRVIHALGGGTHKILDPKGKPVTRIVMEYFRGGNLLNMTQQEGGWYTGEEAQIWSLFVCLAKATAVLEYGKDMPENKDDCARGWRGPICHGDVWEANIFVDGFPTRDGEHVSAARIVVADFGGSEFVADLPPKNNVAPGAVAEQVKKDTAKIEKIIVQIEDLNEVVYGEEMNEQDVKKEKWRLQQEIAKLQDRIRTAALPEVPCGNVWDIGKVMWTLLNGGGHNLELNFDDEYGRGDEGWNRFVRRFKTRVNQLGFSKELMVAILRCMYPDPKKRPTPLALVEKTLEGLKKVDVKAWEAAKYAVEPRPRERLATVGKNEKPIWETDWETGAPLAELRGYKEGMEGVERYDEIKGVRETYEKRDFERFGEGFGR